MRKTAKIRVFTLAKKLGVTNEEVLRVLRELNVGVRSNLSSVEESVAQTVEMRLKHKSRAKGKKKAAAPEIPARLKPRLVRRADAVGKAKEIIQEALKKKAPEDAQEPPAAEETKISPAPAAKPPDKQPLVAKPALPKVRTPTIPPPSVPNRIQIPNLRTRPFRPVVAHRPLARHAVPSHPVQKPTAHKRKSPRPVPVPPPPRPTGEPIEVILSEGVTVKELAEKTSRGTRELIQFLMRKGIMATINQPLDRATAEKICSELGYEAKFITFEEEEILHLEEEEKDAHLLPRDPVVTVMGHVDHGKTSLLDAIRESDIVSKEHGGITQHIGAYHVTHKGRGITFLDTPGHEAFTRMRSRGAQATDIVVLVVAADDGVMPQTLEAIDHSRAAGVPIVVAVNKIDKPEADPEKVKRELADRDLLIEEYGGDTVCVEVSAKARTAIVDLLDMILLVADVKELRANPERHGTGTVLEAKLDRTRGAVATVLIQNGTVRMGDPYIAGASYGKVRAMFDEDGNKIKSAGPSRPVEILGLQGVPQAGDSFQVLSDESKARQIGSLRQIRLREANLRKSTRLTLEGLHRQIDEGEVKELPLILKGDVQGSVEVLANTLSELGTSKVQVKILHSATGPINETDVLLATASNGIIIGFNVKPERKAQELANAEAVQIRIHNVIYEVEDQIRKAMEGLLEPIIREIHLAHAEVMQVFRIRKLGLVAGCMVLDGTFPRNALIRVLREDQVLFQGKTSSLRRFKDDVSEVKSGLECGIGIEDFDKLQAGDRIEAYRTEEVSAVLETA